MNGVRWHSTGIVLHNICYYNVDPFFMPIEAFPQWMEGPMPKFTLQPLDPGVLERLKALTHYVCCTCDPDDLGATKLNKVLWYSDLKWFLEHGESITGAKYVKRQNGPMAMHFYDVIKQLVDEGAIFQRGVEYYGYPKTEYIPMKRATLSDFKPEQISLIDRIAEYVCQKNTAKSISCESHDVIWELAEIGEEIPFYAAFGAVLGEITEDDIYRVQKKLGIQIENVA